MGEHPPTAVITKMLQLQERAGRGVGRTIVVGNLTRTNVVIRIANGTTGVLTVVDGVIASFLVERGPVRKGGATCPPRNTDHRRKVATKSDETVLIVKPCEHIYIWFVFTCYMLT